MCICVSVCVNTRACVPSLYIFIIYVYFIYEFEYVREKESVVFGRHSKEDQANSVISQDLTYSIKVVYAKDTYLSITPFSELANYVGLCT